MKLRIDTSALLLGCLVSTASAVLVSQGSPCEKTCGNVLTRTFPEDISCSASEYQQSAGVVFQGCVECEMTSTYTNDRKETDLQWMLYNIRYATSSCLFGYPNHVDWNDNPCRTRTACGPLEDAIKFNELATNTTTFGYCEKWDAAQVASCNACLGNGEKFFGLRNFVTMLDAACLQLPSAGSLVAVEGDPFSYEQVNITNPALLTETIDFAESSFTLGAKVGVAVGGTLLVLVVLGLFIVWNGKRRRRAFLKTLETQHGGGRRPNQYTGGEMFETPISQKPLTGWADSPLTPSKQQFPRYFSPYSSQYNSPTSGVESTSHFQWPDKSQAQQIRIGLALGGDNPGNTPQGNLKGKEREEYELTEVDSTGNEYLPRAPEAPVLQHPGYGRSNS